MTKTRRGLVELLSERVVIGDGAMGTMLYERGVFLNRCFDELNLSDPKTVGAVHRAYVEAGADFIETNTFGANEVKLSKFGLGDRVAEVNESGVVIARKAAGDGALVAGAVGPLGADVSTYGRINEGEASRIFGEQVRALVNAGVDFILFETFSNPHELIIAVRAASHLADVPIVAQMTTNEQNETLYGNRIDEAISWIAVEEAVTAVGLNCAIGPSAMLASLELIRPVTDKPISVQPNAVMPRDIEGRTMYMCTPEYMAEYAKRFFEKGARIIGGCCGTTPAHIEEIVRAVGSLDRATARVEGSARVCVRPVDGSKGCEAVPLAGKSRIGVKLSAGEKIASIELLPPRGTEIEPMLDKVRECADMGVDAINIPDGPRASSRLSAMVTAVKVQQSADIEAILHVCCRDRNLIGMQSDMLGAYTIGLRNVLLVTGDPPKLGDYPDATAVFDLDSIALTRLVERLGRGLDVAGNELPLPVALTRGVGANPVAADLEREIERFRLKVEAGAEYAITQPVFDTRNLTSFLDAIKGFSVPMVAGIWPFSSYKNAEFMANEVPGVEVPESLLKRMSSAKTLKKGRRIGIEIAREMVAELEPHVAGFAVSAPLGNVRIALAVLGKLEPDEV